MEAVYAGNVGDQRNTILLLGLGIAILGTAVFCSAPRLLLVASAFLGAVTFFVSRGVIQDVRAVTEDDSELVTEVGWALYWIEVAALVGVILSIVGMRKWRSLLRS